MGRFNLIAILGIIIGVVSITSGVGLAGIGLLENQQAPPLSTERVCEEYYSNPEMEGMNDTEKMIYRGFNDSYHRPSECKNYTAYTTGGGSPGNSKIAGGLVFALIGGVVVHRSTE